MVTYAAVLAHFTSVFWPEPSLSIGMLSQQGCGLCSGRSGCEPGVCWTQNVMLCLQCHRWQPKEKWSRAQWKASKCVLLDLQRNCCSACSIDWWTAYTAYTYDDGPYGRQEDRQREQQQREQQHEGGSRWQHRHRHGQWLSQQHEQEPQQRQQEPPWVQSLLVVLRVASVGELVQRTYWLASLGSRIEKFMCYWVENLGRHYRKNLSHFGALWFRQGMEGVCRTTGDWVDPVSLVRFFDPGNDIYSRAFHLAFSDLSGSGTTIWNAETQGDIFEGLLALKNMDDYWTIRGIPGYPTWPRGHAARSIAAWIEALVFSVWGLSLIYPTEDSPPEWVRRWQVIAN